MSRNIFAFTDQTSPYPGYVSLNLEDTGKLVLTVRQSEDGNKLASLDLPDDQVEALITNCGMYMTAKLPHRAEDVRQRMIDDEVRTRMAANGGIAHEMAVVGSAMRQDAEYLWTWHCNLTMAYVDAGGDKKTAMQASARFLYNLTKADVAKDPRYQEDLERLTNA